MRKPDVASVIKLCILMNGDKKKIQKEKEREETRQVAGVTSSVSVLRNVDDSNASSEVRRRNRNSRPSSGQPVSGTVGQSAGRWRSGCRRTRLGRFHGGSPACARTRRRGPRRCPSVSSATNNSQLRTVYSTLSKRDRKRHRNLQIVV